MGFISDPLSPLSFVLALEILACQIKQDDNIRGTPINKEEIKPTTFAEDNYDLVFKRRLSRASFYEVFSKYSG